MDMFSLFNRCRERKIENIVLTSLSTSASTLAARSKFIRPRACFTRLQSGLISRWCMATARLRPDSFEYVYADTSCFCFKNSGSVSLSSGNIFPLIDVRRGSSSDSILTSWSSSWVACPIPQMREAHEHARLLCCFLRFGHSHRLLLGLKESLWRCNYNIDTWCWHPNPFWSLRISA